MDRIFGSGAAAIPPAFPASPSNGYPQGANPGLGVPSTKTNPWWYYMITEEIRNVITAAAITPNGAAVNQLQAAISAMIAAQAPQFPAGMVLSLGGTTAPTGFIKANGALLNRTTYAALWAFAQASGNITATDADWSANTTPGKYSPGDGASTFRVPDLRGLFLRSWDDSAGIDAARAIGSLQLATAITDQGNNNGTIGISNSEGQVTTTTSALTSSINAYPPVTTHRVRPINAALLSCIKY